MTSEVEKWLIEHPDTSSDYMELLRRMESGESVECVIECAIEFGGKSHLCRAEYASNNWRWLFCLVSVLGNWGSNHTDPVSFSENCERLNLVFCVAEQDFLKSTRKMLQIAKNAAEFKAVSVPLNTLEDVEKMLELMNRVEVANGSL